MTAAQLYFVFTLIGFGLLFLMDVLRSGWGAIPHLPLTFLLAFPAGGVIFGIHRLLAESGGKIIGMIFEGSGGGKAPPGLSRVRAFIIRYEFDSARTELDGLWAAHPGNGEVLREYERLFEALKAPAGMAEQFEKCLPALRGEPLAYALMKLAELYSGEPGDKGKAATFCRRLLHGSPDSVHAPAARELLERLDKEGNAAG